MGDFIFKTKYKVVCTECSHDEFEQVDESIQCVHCQTQYEWPDSFHIEPFDLEIKEKKEH